MSDFKKMRFVGVMFAIFIVLLGYHRYKRSEEKTMHVYCGSTMGTLFSVKVVDVFVDKKLFAILSDKIDEILVVINKSTSIFYPSSEISTFNNNVVSGEPQLVSDDFAFLVKKSIEMYDSSHGCFDITIGPLVDLWGFGPDRHATIPQAEQIDYLLDVVGVDKIKLEENELTKIHPDVKLDLNAIAKGYAVDKICDFLESENCRNFMVEVGGEVVCRGVNANGNIWRIGIDTPDPKNFPGQNIQAIVTLENKAMATSGDYRNFKTIEGKIYSHTIDPKTGWPVDHGLASVTVISDSCVMADAYATAANVMGLDDGLQWIESLYGVDAYFIQRNEDGTFLTKKTENFTTESTEK